MFFKSCKPLLTSGRYSVPRSVEPKYPVSSDGNQVSEKQGLLSVGIEGTFLSILLLDFRTQMVEIEHADILYIGANAEDSKHLPWLLSAQKNPSFSIEFLPDFTTLESSSKAILILLDASEANGHVFESLSTLRRKAPNIPVVILTEEDKDGFGKQAIRMGAQDFLIRSQITTESMVRSMVNAIERHQVQQASSSAAPLLDSATAVLNRLPMGVIMVAAEGNILFMNEKANGFLSTGDGLMITADRKCVATEPSENKALSQLLQDTLSSDTSSRNDGEFALSLTRNNSDSPLTVMIAPLGTGKAGKGAVIFVSDPMEPVEISMDTICRLYSLTPAEGRLALGLTNGRTLDDMAAEWSVSMHTVRSQLRQIFRKTDTSRQSELVKLILTGPAAIPATPII